MEVKWELPLEWCHSGLPQGNGLFGILVWGDKSNLKITFNRSDYWFHGENLPPGKEQTYANLKKNLAARNEAEVKRIFAGIHSGGERPLQSTRLPVGRLDVRLPQSNGGELELDTRSSAGTFNSASGDLQIESVVPREMPVFALTISGKEYRNCQFSSVPADAEPVIEFYNRNHFPPFKKADSPDNRSGGWIQEVPGSKTLAVRWVVKEKSDALELFLATALEESVSAAEAAAGKLVDKVSSKGYSAIAEEAAAWWREYWGKVPKIDLPDVEIKELYDFGMYRLAGLCSPDAPPATLQGAWVEEHWMPPWSCDYHFNINVQECYWPVFAGNIPHFILPLFKMIRGWAPVLREYAENFSGVADGQMLPHATDDRGIGLGGFWPGHIDHSSTAWVAQLMWLYWRYTLDNEFAEEILYPFMNAVMNVYDAILEEDSAGNLFLAAETSPEYNESRIIAWGRNPSIHLAAIHFLANSLLELSEVLERDASRKSRWLEIKEKLPKASISEDGEICIWDGQPLDEPHRHFSHLAALHPFDLLDWRNSEEDAELVNKSIRKWIIQGTGLWSGWSFPWASILYSRLETAESAHVMLSVFRRAFMRDDFALRYLPKNRCFTSVVGPSDSSIMQIEAGMAAAAAVMEMFVYSSRGVIYPFAGIPVYWKDVAFEGIRTEGAFLVSGRKTDGVVGSLDLVSTCGAKLKISLPEGEFELVRGDKAEVVSGGKVFEANTTAGERLKFQRYDK